MIVSAVLTVAGLGLVLGIGLVLASKYLAVEEDPRIERVAEELPNANCGGCGYAGCAGFAKAVVAGEANINDCAPMSSDAAAVIAGILGVELEEKAKEVAIVLCAGGNDVAQRKSRYLGVGDCRAAELVAGGDKECPYGCLGLGSCVTACSFDAIEISAEGVAIVDRDKCTACGKCVDACPRNIIKIVPEAFPVHVLCSSQDKGKVVKGYCKVGCIACKLCTRESKPVFDTKTGLSVVNYEHGGDVPASAALVCAPQSIVDTREFDLKDWITKPTLREGFAEKQAEFKAEQKKIKAAKKAKADAAKKAKAEKAKAAAEKAEEKPAKGEAEAAKSDEKADTSAAKAAKSDEKAETSEAKAAKSDEKPKKGDRDVTETEKSTAKADEPEQKKSDGEKQKTEEKADEAEAGGKS